MPARPEGPEGKVEGERPPLRVDPRRIVVLLVVGVLVVAGLLRLSGGREALTALARVPLWRLLLMLAALYAVMTVRAWRWGVLLRAVGHRVELGALWQLLMAGYFLNTVVPARAGDVARIFLLGRWHSVPFEAATGTLVMERALDVVVILCGAATAAYVVLPALVPAAVAEAYLVVLLLVAAAVALLLAAPRLETRLLRLWADRRYQAVMQAGFTFLAAIRQMATDWRHLIVALAQTAVIWSSEIGIAALALGTLGVQLPLGQLAFVVLTVDLAGAVPLLPGALGQVEGAYLSLLLLVGVARDSAGVTVLLHRIVTFWSIMLVGGVTTLLSGALRKDVSAREGEEAE